VTVSHNFALLIIYRFESLADIKKSRPTNSTTFKEVNRPVFPSVGRKIDCFLSRITEGTSPLFILGIPRGLLVGPIEQVWVRVEIEDRQPTGRSGRLPSTGVFLCDLTFYCLCIIHLK